MKKISESKLEIKPNKRIKEIESDKNTEVKIEQIPMKNANKENLKKINFIQRNIEKIKAMKNKKQAGNDLNKNVDKKLNLVPKDNNPKKN